MAAEQTLTLVGHLMLLSTGPGDVAKEVRTNEAFQLVVAGVVRRALVDVLEHAWFLVGLDALGIRWERTGASCMTIVRMRFELPEQGVDIVGQGDA